MDDYCRWYRYYFECTACHLIRAEGDAIIAAIGVSIGGFANIILDPLFILPQFLGLGAEGAGIATAISNMALVKAIKHIGPTLTSIFGAMEPLTAVFIGIVVFHETSTIGGILGMLLIIIAVFIVVVKENRK